MREMPAKGEEWEEDGGRGGGASRATEEIDDRGTEAPAAAAVKHRCPNTAWRRCGLMTPPPPGGNALLHASFLHR